MKRYGIHNRPDGLECAYLGSPPRCTKCGTKIPGVDSVLMDDAVIIVATMVVCGLVIAAGLLNLVLR